MKTVCNLLAIGFIAYVTFGMAYRLHEDFSHREQWGKDMNTDPRVYLTAWGLGAVICIVVLRRVGRESRRNENRLREIEKGIQRDVVDKQREGKREEAMQAMRYYEGLLRVEALKHK
jgi:hypothetical protein